MTKDLWVSDLYMLVHALGHCFTYNPPPDGLPNFEGGIGLFFGNKDVDYKDLHKNQIFIHERDQFWPNDNNPAQLRYRQGYLIKKMTTYKFLALVNVHRCILKET